MKNLDDYPFEIRPLAAAEGGGFLISFPDFSECISDGETIEEAIAHGREAFHAWIESMMDDRKPIPQPNGVAEPAKFVLRLPRTLHSRLANRASAEGVSLNSLVQTYVAEGLGRH